MGQILIIEDDPVVGETLQELLAEEGFDVVWRKTIATGRKTARTEPPDLILLDVNLPDGTGFDLCRELREEDAGLPIIFLTARLDEDSAVKGLSLGAVDYIRKPFARRELLARIRRYLKTAPTALRVGSLVLDAGEKKLTWKGEPVALSPSELSLLALLMRNIGRAVTRDSMLDALGDDGEISAKAVNTYLSRLKSKLDKAGVDGIRIAPVYGTGYRLEKV